jgi:hypothetical protein
MPAGGVARGVRFWLFLLLSAANYQPPVFRSRRKPWAA